MCGQCRTFSGRQPCSWWTGTDDSVSVTTTSIQGGVSGCWPPDLKPGTQNSLFMTLCSKPLCSRQLFWYFKARSLTCENKQTKKALHEHYSSRCQGVRGPGCHLDLSPRGMFWGSGSPARLPRPRPSPPGTMERAQDLTSTGTCPLSTTQLPSARQKAWEMMRTLVIWKEWNMTRSWSTFFRTVVILTLFTTIKKKKKRPWSRNKFKFTLNCICNPGIS